VGWQLLVRSSRTVWIVTASAGVLAAVVGRVEEAAGSPGHIEVSA